MSKRKILVLVLVVILMLGSAGVKNQSRSVKAQDMEPIKIGAIFDLTGPTSDVGRCRGVA